MANIMEGAIATYTGKMVSPFNPDPKSICIEDLAHGMSNTCRFAGQASEFYSVLEHSIEVAAMLPLELKLKGLLHDSPEGILTDIPKPYKHMIPGYEDNEDKLLEAIFAGLKLSYTLPLEQEIKNADAYMYGVEQRLLMPKNKKSPYIMNEDEYKEYVDTYGELRCMSPKKAETVFLGLYETLRYELGV